MQGLAIPPGDGDATSYPAGRHPGAPRPGRARGGEGARRDVGRPGDDIATEGDRRPGPRAVTRFNHQARATASRSERDSHRTASSLPPWTRRSSSRFIDKASDKLARRPKLDKALLSANRSGDQLVITKLDRLGRSLEHLIELSKLLQTSGVDLVVLDQDIDTSTAVGRLFFQILGAIAEFEHALMSERTLDGLAAARARGRTGGQQPKLGPRQVELARHLYDETGDGRQAQTHRRADRRRVRRQPTDDLSTPHEDNRVTAAGGLA